MEFQIERTEKNNNTHHIQILKVPLDDKDVNVIKIHKICM